MKYKQLQLFYPPEDLLVYKLSTTDKINNNIYLENITWEIRTIDGVVVHKVNNTLFANQPTKTNEKCFGCPIDFFIGKKIK